jgi:hypothetical protein
MREKVYIIGYTLDAVMEAVSVASQGYEVEFLATAEVGKPLDDYGDLVSARFKEVLDALLPGMLEYRQYANPRFFYIPYERVAIKNTTNGVIQFPLSRKSFCDDAEWQACVDAFGKPAVQDVLANKANAPSKLVTAMKSAMPAAFADTFCKAMQTTRWRGTQLSHLTMYGFDYEFPLTELANESYNEYYYRPNHTFHEICAALTNIFGITVIPVDRDTARKYITDRNVDGRVIVMDNRIDQYLDYIAGKFDRTRMWCVPEKLPQEIRYSRDGLYYTPLNSCWAVSSFDGECRKFMAEPVETLYDTFISEIPSTKTNIKLHSQYCALVERYGDKKLDLGQRAETLIKA